MKRALRDCDKSIKGNKEIRIREWKFKLKVSGFRENSEGNYRSAFRVMCKVWWYDLRFEAVDLNIWWIEHKLVK